MTDIPIGLDGTEVIYYKSKMDLEAHTEFEPFHSGDRVIYVCARRGAGKSTFCNTYIKNYVDATDGRVFFISRFEDDPSIHLPVRSMRLSVPQLMEVPLDLMKNSLLVFDDVDNAQYTRKEMLYLKQFIIDAIANSRHFTCSILITSHLISNYAKTRDILNEMSDLVVFPAYSNSYQIQRALKTYVGLNQSQIENIMKVSDSRWVMIKTVSPKFIMTQHHIHAYT